MILFSQIVLVLLTLILPFIGTMAYCYIKDSGWKPVVYGILEMGTTLILLRLILPMIFINSDWFLNLLNNQLAFNFVYCLAFALILTLLNFIAFRFHLQSCFLASKGVVFGFEEGFIYEALFIGFVGLSSLLSSSAPDIDPSAIGGLWMALAEALSVLVFFAGFGYQMAKGVENKDYKWIALYALEVFALLWIGSCWSLWNLPRLVFIVLMLVLAGVTAWLLKDKIDWSLLFNQSETNEPQEDPDYLKELEEYEKKLQAKRKAQFEANKKQDSNPS